MDQGGRRKNKFELVAFLRYRPRREEGEQIRVSSIVEV